MEDATHAEWRVGSRGIQAEDLILLGLQHVSTGSWQAHFRLLLKDRAPANALIPAPVRGALSASNPHERVS